MAVIEQEAEAFSKKIQARHLPIEQADAYDFAKAILKRKPPRNWLDKVVRACQFIDENTFEQDLTKLVQISRHFMDDQPYAVLVSFPHKSDFWIYEQLQKRGLPSVTMSYTGEEFKRENDAQKVRLEKEILKDPDMSLQQRIKLLKTPSPLHRWLKNLPTGLPVCTFDDFSISGTAIWEMFGAPNKKTDTKENFHAFFNYSTAAALNYLVRSGIKPHHLGTKVTILKEFMSPQDLHFLEKVTLQSGVSTGITRETATMFWTWYKVPDNINEIFTGKGLPPLIRPERFQSPYKPHSPLT